MVTVDGSAKCVHVVDLLICTILHLKLTTGYDYNANPRNPWDISMNLLVSLGYMDLTDLEDSEIWG